MNHQREAVVHLQYVVGEQFRPDMQKFMMELIVLCMKKVCCFWCVSRCDGAECSLH